MNAVSTELSPGALDALRRLVASLPQRRVAQLMAAVAELQQTDISFPGDIVLGVLRAGDANGRPSLKRLVCEGFESFLTNEALATQVVGLIPRSAIEPWWAAMGRMAGEELGTLEAELARLQQSGDDIGEFAVEARRKACLWTESFITELKKGRRLVADLRGMFKDELVRAQVADIGRTLRICEPIITALRAITPEDHIAELDEQHVERTKAAYPPIPEALGPDTPYFAHAFLNRLDKPWQMMRVAQALGWKRSAKRDDELSAVCLRLLRLLTRSADEIAIEARKATSHTASGMDFAELRALLGRYAALAEALNGVVDFRKDSDWSAEIIKSRTKMRSAFAADRIAPLEHIVTGFLQPVHGADLPPIETSVPDAVEAAKLVAAIAHHGARHGFASDARVLSGKLGKQLDLHAERLLARPQGVEPQLAGLVKVVRVLFKDAHTETLARRVDNAFRKTAYNVPPILASSAAPQRRSDVAA